MRALRLSFASRARDLRKYSCGGCTGACACENGLEGARLADEPRASEAWADRLSILKAAQGGASCEGQTESPCIGGENILQLFTTMHAPPVNRTFARRVRARDSYAWTADSGYGAAVLRLVLLRYSRTSKRKIGYSYSALPADFTSPPQCFSLHVYVPYGIRRVVLRYLTE